jgi:molybdopterin-binding protein
MLTLDKISKNFSGFNLNAVSFTVEKGDYFILLGESGAGKSMVLETIAGLVPPDAGSIFLEGKNITTEKIQNRRIGLVFQDYAIFPHLTVKENIEYSLHGNRLNHRQKQEKLHSITVLLGITELLQRRPSTLSGGELQRVALARTLIQQPLILLLDEPLASLDTLIKADLRSMLREIHRHGQTILHVTHDYEEALSLGNKIAVIDKGSIIQEGTPEEVFRYPKSEFVAHFVGVKNFYKVILSKENGTTFGLVEGKIRIRIATNEQAELGYIALRSEDIFISTETVHSSALNNFSGDVKEIIPAVNGVEVIVDIGVRMHVVITRDSLASLGITEGSMIWIHFKATAVRFIKA